MTIWSTKLPNVDHGLLPPSIPRPNPVVFGPFVFAAVFSPGAIVCLSRRNGKILWRRELPPFGDSSVHVAGGRLFVKSPHTLFALSPESGKELWQFCPCGDKGEWIYSSPLVTRKSVYIGDRRGALHCLDVQTGKVLWTSLTNRKQANANSTPVSVSGKVIIGDNAKKISAFDPINGRCIWTTRVDGPSVFGLLIHRGRVLVATESVYLLDPADGKVHQHIKFDDSASYVENFGRLFAVILRDTASTGMSKVLFCDSQKGVVSSTSHKVWCPTLRSVPETRLGYLSHLGGLRILDEEGHTKANVSISGEGLGLVDVVDHVIYCATGRGRVLALRHPNLG